MQSGRISKGEKLVPVDHTNVTYPPFRKVRLCPWTHLFSCALPCQEYTPFLYFMYRDFG